MRTTKGDPYVKALMARHYSAPKGFVGRQLVYRVEWDGVPYGAFAWGSTTRHLPGRVILGDLGNGMNNVFYHVEPIAGKYPCRNFTTRVLKAAIPVGVADYEARYGQTVWWVETMVELPRTGETYRRAGWTEVGLTKGLTCKRVSGASTDGWSGRRVWSSSELRPKRVFVKVLSST